MENKKTGAVILKSIPTKTAEEQVVAYLKQITKNVADEKIVEKIRQTPRTLFKNVTNKTGEKIAADLIRLGAIASFVTPDTHAASDVKQQDDTESKDHSAEPKVQSHWLRKMSWSKSVFVAGMAACLLIFIYFYTQNASQSNVAPEDKTTQTTSSRTTAKPADDKVKRESSEKNISTQASVSGAGTQQAIGNSSRKRVGIYICSANIPGLADLPYAKNLSVRVAETLKNDTVIQIVARNQIDHFVKQDTLTVKQLLNPKDAARIGQKAGADILIVGQLISKDKQENQYKEKSVAVMAIETASASMIDMGCFQYNQYPSYSAWFDHLVEFVRTASRPGMSLDQRSFLVLGDFEDRSRNKSKRNNKQNLLYFLKKELAGQQHVCIISQSHVKHFLNTLNLNEKDMSQDSENKKFSNPVFTSIGGSFALTPNAETPFNMDLQVQFLGRTKQRLNVTGKSWDDGLDKLKSEIDIILHAKADLKKQKWLREKEYRECKEQGPLCEAKAHFQRGKQLSNIDYSHGSPGLNVSLYADGQGFDTRDLGAGKLTPDGKRQRLSPERKLKNVLEAIDAFESALFLDPGNYEIKLFLAVCLSHPDVAETNRSKDLLNQIAAKSGDDRLKFIAAKTLGITESVTYSPSFSKRVFTPEYYASTYAADLTYLLLKDDEQVLWWRYPPGKMKRFFKAIDKSIYAQCENVVWQTTQNGGKGLEHAVYKASASLKDLTWHVSKNERVAEHCQQVISEIRKKYPRLIPNMLVNCDVTSSEMLIEEFLITLRYIESGDIVPILPQKFSDKLYGLFIYCAVSEKKLAAEAGVQIENYLAKQKGHSVDKLHLACCYKGLGKLDKAMSLLEKIDGANDPKIKDAFLNQPCRAFRKILTAELRKKEMKRMGVQPETAKKKTKRTIGSVLRVPQDRIIHAIAQDGADVWVCANLRQNPIAPDNIYDPILYRYRNGMKEPDSLILPDKIKGMATSIVANNNTLWVGTDEGLLEMQPKRNIVRHYKEDEGLLKPNINSLCLKGDKLYIGLGSGIGYLDLKTRKFIGLVTTNDVIRVAATTSGLWAISQQAGLSYFSGKSDQMEFQSPWKCSDAYALAADLRYAVIGKNLQVGRHFGMRNVGSGGLVIYDQKRKQKRRMPGKGALAGTDIFSLAFADRQLWVGGRGFLAVVDVEQHKRLDQLTGKGAAFHALLPDNSGGVWVSQGYKLYHLGYGPDGFYEK